MDNHLTVLSEMLNVWTLFQVVTAATAKKECYFLFS